MKELSRNFMVLMGLLAEAEGAGGGAPEDL